MYEISAQAPGWKIDTEGGREKSSVVAFSGKGKTKGNGVPGRMVDGTSALKSVTLLDRNTLLATEATMVSSDVVTVTAPCNCVQLIQQTQIALACGRTHCSCDVQDPVAFLDESNEPLYRTTSTIGAVEQAPGTRSKVDLYGVGLILVFARTRDIHRVGSCLWLGGRAVQDALGRVRQFCVHGYRTCSRLCRIRMMGVQWGHIVVTHGCCEQQLSIGVGTVGVTQRVER